MSFQSSTRFLPFIATLLLAAVAWSAANPVSAADTMLKLAARQQVPQDAGEFKAAETTLAWDAKKTAIVVCDMWDKHWCAGATKRVAEMAPRMNEVISAARDKGVLIIHCLSSCLDYYQDTPMRNLAQQAPVVETKIPLQRWCHLDKNHESPLPIDDSDGGCDCWPPCKNYQAWKRQIDAIEIREGDAVTDSAEAYYLMKQRGIDNVIVMGVHTNMCVLGRPFSIRQLVSQGQNVVLMRDMTDTMYNSRMKPFVPHVQGTDLVVEHIEKYWCPTIASTAFAAQLAFTFAGAKQPHVVFMIGEREYETNITLPEFAKKQLEPRGVRCTFIHADEVDKNNFAGLAALKTADLLFVSVRRRSPPKEQLDLVREYVAAGKPVVGIRTASHAFHTKGVHPDGHDEWQEFDAQILGGNYHGHHANGVTSVLKAAEGAGGHPILAGVSLDSFVGGGSLYQVSPLAKTATPLVIGSIPDHPSEPVAWAHQHGDSRVFYTSLGHISDFKSEAFNRMLANAVFWALDVRADAANAKSFVYVSVAGENRIAIYELNETSGELTLRGSTAVSGDPGALTVAPNQKFLFASIRSVGNLASFRLDAESGSLARINEVAAGADPAYVATDKTGQFLLSAYYQAGKIAVHTIDEQGFISSQARQEVATDQKAHAIITDRSNRFAFVPHTGPNAIFQFVFDAKTGRVTADQFAKVQRPANTGPRHIWFHPTRDLAYVSDEQGSSITVYRFDRANGQLSPLQTVSTLPAGFDGGNSTADIEVHPSGRFVYVSNRGHDSIARFQIDSESGTVTALGQTPTEPTPRSFNIDPSGRYLIAAGQSSGKLATYRIDAKSGDLSRLATYEIGMRPWWVLVVRFDD